jgi:hypothetical protein
MKTCLEALLGSSAHRGTGSSFRQPNRNPESFESLENLLLKDSRNRGWFLQKKIIKNHFSGEEEPGIFDQRTCVSDFS